MKPEYFYLMVNIGTILFPLLFTFEKKVAFYKSWKFIFPAIILTAIPFILFDHYYTVNGIWSFNPKYITGYKLFNLPVEEILFFFTIPYACLYIYEGLNKVFGKSIFFDSGKNVVSTVVILICLLFSIIYSDRPYTLVICWTAGIIVTLQTFILRSSFMGDYWRFFIIQLVPFIIVNGLLTGTLLGRDVFTYNETSISNIRLTTIPIEDAFFSLTLLLVNVSLFELFRKLSHFRSLKNVAVV